MKMPGCRTLATSDLFLLKKSQDNVTLRPDTTMKGIIVRITGM